MTAYYNFTILVFIIVLIGWLVIPRINRDVATKSETASRKREFIGFLEEWKADISAPDRGPTKIDVSIPTAVKAYDAKVGAFQKQVAIVRDVFSDADRFETLTIKLGNLKAEDWKEKQRREVILEALDALIQFVKAA
jgi:hypothetical protein